MYSVQNFHSTKCKAYVVTLSVKILGSYQGEVCVVFFYLSKSFDSVSHAPLLNKLNDRSTP